MAGLFEKNRTQAGDTVLALQKRLGIKPLVEINPATSYAEMLKSEQLPTQEDWQAITTEFFSEQIFALCASTVSSLATNATIDPIGATLACTFDYAIDKVFWDMVPDSAFESFKFSNELKTIIDSVTKIGTAKLAAFLLGTTLNPYTFIAYYALDTILPKIVNQIKVKIQKQKENQALFNAILANELSPSDLPEISDGLKKIAGNYFTSKQMSYDVMYDWFYSNYTGNPKGDHSALAFKTDQYWIQTVLPAYQIVKSLNAIKYINPAAPKNAQAFLADVNSNYAFAQGGIVTGPVHALVGEGGEPEMILPLSKAKELGFLCAHDSSSSSGSSASSDSTVSTGIADWAEGAKSALNELKKHIFANYGQMTSFGKQFYALLKQQQEETSQKKIALLEKELKEEEKKRDEQLAKNQGRYNQESEELANLYAWGRISYETYKESQKTLDEEKARNDEELAQRAIELEKQKLEETNKVDKAQFESEKRSSLAQALMGGANAFIQALSTGGPFLGPILAGVIAGMTAAQVGIIASQQFTPVALASGGIVNSPTRALIGEGGEPEMVLPLSKAHEMGFGGNNGTVNITVQIMAPVYSDRDLCESVYQGIKQAQRTGAIPAWN